MRFAAAAAALLLAGFAACSGDYGNGTYRPPDGGGISIGGGTTDGGDGGQDGGDGGLDAGDGGPDAGFDAGCAPLTLNGVLAIDGCPNGVGVTTSATGTVNTTNCTIDISIPTAIGPCVGAVSGGTANAFDGGCQGGFYACTAPSLPGTLTCVHGSTICAIKICDAGASCP